MNKSIKLVLTILTFFMLLGCSANQSVLVGDTVDIENYKRPSNIVKYQWSFDTKPVTSRLDPRDFIPSNYHPNVTFIPDEPGKYIVRLTMINNEGTVLHKNFVFTADPQPDYLADIENKKKEPEKKAETQVTQPKIIEIPVVTEKVVLKKTTVTKKPNEWLTAPIPGQNPEDVKQEPAYTTESSVTEVIEEEKKPVVLKENDTKKTIVTESKPVTPIVGNAKYTLQVSSSTVEAYALELRDKLIAQGYDAFIQKADVEGLLRYRIRVGHFMTYDAAKAYRQRMLDTTDYEPWIDKIK